MNNKIYVVDESIKLYSGNGNGAVIVKAIDPQNPQLKLCAKITELHDENKRDQDQEREVLEILSKTEQRNIVKIYQVYEKDKKRYVIMEQCDMSLTKYIQGAKKNKQLSTLDFIDIVKQVSDGYRFFNSKNILHRDIKSDNILVNVNFQGQPTLKIADFDISMVFSQYKLKTTNMKGTEQNKAPEIKNKSEYSFEADVYAFGISLLQLFCCDIDSKIKNLFVERLEIHQNLEAIKNSTEEKDIDLIKKLQFNKCNQMVQQILNQMLAYNPQQRLNWEAISACCSDFQKSLQYKELLAKPILSQENTFIPLNQQQKQFKKSNTVLHFQGNNQNFLNGKQVELGPKQNNIQQLNQNPQSQQQQPLVQDKIVNQIPNSAKPFQNSLFPNQNQKVQGQQNQQYSNNFQQIASAKQLPNKEFPIQQGTYVNQQFPVQQVQQVQGYQQNVQFFQGQQQGTILTQPQYPQLQGQSQFKSIPQQNNFSQQKQNQNFQPQQQTNFQIQKQANLPPQQQANLPPQQQANLPPQKVSGQGAPQVDRFKRLINQAGQVPPTQFQAQQQTMLQNKKFTPPS